MIDLRYYNEEGKFLNTAWDVYRDYFTARSSFLSQYRCIPSSERKNLFLMIVSCYKLLVRDGDIISPKVIPSEPLKNQCLEFVEAVTTGKRPIADGAFSSGVTRAMAAIEASIRLGGAAVPV